MTNNKTINFNKKHKKLFKYNNAFIAWFEKLKEYQAYQIASEESKHSYDIISLAYAEILAMNNCYITRLQNNPLATFINSNNSKEVRDLFKKFGKQNEFILKVKLIKSFMDLIVLKSSNIVNNKINEDQLGIYTFKQQVDGWDKFLFSQKLNITLKAKKITITQKIKL